MATLPQKLVAEALGTFILVFVVISAGGILAPIAIASSLMVGIFAFGPLSGANFNPAVSTGLRMCNLWHEPSDDDEEWGLDCKEWGLYILVQLLGALLACFSALGLQKRGNANFRLPVFPPHYAAQADGTAGAEVEWYKIAVAEMVFTAMLVFVVLNTAVLQSSKGNSYFGLAIGFTIVAATVAVGTISGAVLNPAVVFAITMANAMTGQTEWGHALWMFPFYAVFQLLGGVLAATIFYLLRRDEFDDEHENKSTISHGLGVTFGAELCGTFFLALTVALGIMGGSPLLALGIASALMVMVYSLGSCSGANFNPAVSTAMLVFGKLGNKDNSAVVVWATYCAAQIIGGLWGVWLAIFITTSHKCDALGLPSLLTYRNDAPKGGPFPDAISVCGAEFFFTFMLVLVFLNTAVVNAPNSYFGISIGFVMVAAFASVGSISGAMLNPAVTIGLSISVWLWDVDGAETAAGIGQGKNFWFLLYVVVQVAAGAVAALITQFLQDNDSARGALLRTKDDDEA